MYEKLLKFPNFTRYLPEKYFPDPPPVSSALCSNDANSVASVDRRLLTGLAYDCHKVN